MRKFGLIGYPLSHSFSKKYFTDKFLREDIKGCMYETYAIDTIDKLTTLLNDRELEGLNVTIPYKKQVIPFLTDASDAVKKIQACNCIKISTGKLTGYNTDVAGFEISLQKYLQPHHNRALVFGTGGAAAAVKFVLQKLNIEYLIVSRNKEIKANAISYDDVNEALLSSHLLLINTTPLGMSPSYDTCPAIPYHFITREHYLYDLVYNPEKTLFLQKGESRGAIIQNGYEMLIIQAEESWKIWNKL